MTIRKVCVLGGTGFVGRHLCCELSRRKLQIRVLTRRRERRRDLLVIPSLELVEADVLIQASISTSPLSASWAIAGTSPSAFQRISSSHRVMPAPPREQ